MTEPLSPPSRSSVELSPSAARVDVGIPTYGRPTYLAEAIESVLAQTFSAWRLTVSDNGPGGGEAAAVVARYDSDPRVNYAVTGGVPMRENWTRCIQAGSAPYVALLADDEYWDPEFLANRVVFLDANPACGLVFSNSRAVDDRGRELAPRAHRVSEGLHPPLDFVPRLFEDQLIPATPVMVRRAAYEAVGPAFSDHSELMDYEMWLRIALRYPIGYLAVTDCAGRFHAASVTSRSKALGLGRLRFLDHAESLIQRDLPGLVLPAGLRRRRRARFLVTCALDAVEEGSEHAARRYLRAAVRVYPSSLLDPRVPAALTALAGGERGRRMLSTLRRFERRSHRLRILYREAKLATRRLKGSAGRG